jgi:RNA polymerase sigma-54 factor
MAAASCGSDEKTESTTAATTATTAAPATTTAAETETTAEATETTAEATETTEESTETTAEATETTEEKSATDEIDWEEILLDGFDAGGRREEREEREYYEPITVDTRDLGDHLRDQISLLDLSGRQEFLADEFIGNINEDG